MTSVLPFKNYLNRNKLQSSYYFHVGSRLGQILHARLRMQYNALHADLHRKNIVGSSSCQHCGGFEGAYYLFFMYPAYVVTRSYLPDNLKGSLIWHST